MTRSLFAVIAVAFALAAPAYAADSTNPAVKGLYLLSDYPAVTVQPGTTSTVTLHLHNYALPPERLSLSVSGVPDRLDRDIVRGRPARCRSDAGQPTPMSRSICGSTCPRARRSARTR